MEFWLIALFLLVLTVALGIVTVVVAKRKRESGKAKEPNYQVFFSMGIIFLALGVVFTAAISPGFMGFIALGIIYMIIGLANRDKWKKKEQPSVDENH